jgi:hypothetical protein
MCKIGYKRDPAKMSGMFKDAYHEKYDDGLNNNCAAVETFREEPDRAADGIQTELKNCKANYNTSSFARLRPVVKLDDGSTEIDDVTQGETFNDWPAVGSWGAECWCPKTKDSDIQIGEDPALKNE